MQNNILKLFFSLQKHSQECYESKCFLELTKRKFTKNLFKKYLKLRKTLLSILNIQDSNLSPPVLSKLYMNKHEVKVFCDRINKELYKEVESWTKTNNNEIKKLRLETRKGDKNSEKKLKSKEKLFKKNCVNSAVLLHKIFLPEIAKDLEDQEYLIKKGGIEHDLRIRLHKETDIEGIDDNDVLEIDDEGNILKDEKTKEEVVSEQRYARLIKLEAKKKKLVEEIQKFSKDSNCKRQAAVMMIGLMKVLDELTEPGFDIVQKCTKDRIFKYKKEKIDDPEDDVMGRELVRVAGGYGVVEFFRKGCMIKKHCFQETSMALDVNHFRIGEEWKEKARAYNTHMKRHKEKIEKDIQENPELFLKRKKEIDKERANERIEEQERGIRFNEINVNNLKTMEIEVKPIEGNQSVEVEEEVREEFEEGIDAKFEDMIGNVDDGEEEVMEIGEEELQAAMATEE